MHYSYTIEIGPSWSRSMVKVRLSIALRYFTDFVIAPMFHPPTSSTLLLRGDLSPVTSPSHPLPSSGTDPSGIRIGAFEEGRGRVREQERGRGGPSIVVIIIAPPVRLALSKSSGRHPRRLLLILDTGVVANGAFDEGAWVRPDRIPIPTTAPVQSLSPSFSVHFPLMSSFIGGGIFACGSL